jgi:hypothetical protein
MCNSTVEAASFVSERQEQGKNHHPDESDFSIRSIIRIARLNPLISVIAEKATELKRRPAPSRIGWPSAARGTFCCAVFHQLPSSGEIPGLMEPRIRVLRVRWMAFRPFEHRATGRHFCCALLAMSTVLVVDKLIDVATSQALRTLTLSEIQLVLVIVSDAGSGTKLLLLGE